jgi:hypothetical protein
LNDNEYVFSVTGRSIDFLQEEIENKNNPLNEKYKEVYSKLIWKSQVYARMRPE